MGWEPDGSGFDWDNKKHPNVSIGEISFSLPFVVPTDDDEDSEMIATTADMAPASRAQLEKLIQKVESLLNDYRILLAVAIAVAILAATRFGW